MQRSPTPPDRRRFLQAAASLCLVSTLPAAEHPRSQPPPRPDKPSRKLAVVTTAYHYLSHAYHVCGRFLYGYLRDGKMHYPDFGRSFDHGAQANLLQVAPGASTIVTRPHKGKFFFLFFEEHIEISGTA